MRRFVGALDARESDKDQSLVRWPRLLEVLFLSSFSYFSIIIIIIVTIVCFIKYCISSLLSSFSDNVLAFVKKQAHTGLAAIENALDNRRTWIKNR